MNSQLLMYDEKSITLAYRIGGEILLTKIGEQVIWSIRNGPF